MAAARPPPANIKSKKYARTCNVKPLTAILRYCAFRPDPEVYKENKETADGAWNLPLIGRKQGGREGQSGRPVVIGFVGCARLEELGLP